MDISKLVTYWKNPEENRPDWIYHAILFAWAGYDEDGDPYLAGIYTLN